MGINSLRLTLTSPDNNYHHSCTEKVTKIGRSLKCDFNIPREELSREHGQIELIGDDIFITDLDSKNGITVDQVRIEPNKPVKITTSSEVVFSNVYILKLNALEIKTKADMGYAKPAAAPEIETVSFQLDLPQEKDERKRFPVKRSYRPPKPDVAAETNHFETVKMVLGFAAVVAAIIYQALGK